MRRKANRFSARPGPAVKVCGLPQPAPVPKTGGVCSVQVFTWLGVVWRRAVVELQEVIS